MIMMGLFRALKHAWMKNTSYVSETDRFLKSLTKAFPKLSESQEKEIEKHRHIFYRDTEKKIRW